MPLAEHVQADQADTLRTCAENIRGALEGMEIEYRAKRAPLERLLRGCELLLGEKQNPPTVAEFKSDPETRPFEGGATTRL